jgi:hypothetical protein
MLTRMRGSRPALLGAAALLLIVVLAAHGESPVPFSAPTRVPGDLPETIDDSFEEATPTTTPPPSTDASAPPRGEPELVVWPVLGLAILLLLVACVLAVRVWLRLRRRVGVGDVVDPVHGRVDPELRLRVRKAVEQARDLLAREGGEPRNAVIEAWVLLENATEHHREPHQTATEFAAVLANSENTDDLREFRVLYQRARFGHHSSATDARAAHAALDRILATIR